MQHSDEKSEFKSHRIHQFMKITRCDHCKKDKLPHDPSQRGNMCYTAPMPTLAIDRDIFDFCNLNCLQDFLTERKANPGRIGM